MEKKKVYAVAEGEYSEYHIECVFSTKEKAKEFVQCHGMGYRIEEYELDQPVERKEKLWYVSFNTKNSKTYECSPTSCEKMRDKCHVERDKCHVENGYIENIIGFYVDAETMNEAIKIARERYTAVKSNDYIWIRLTRPIAGTTGYGCRGKYEVFNIKTNEFTKE